MRESRVARHPRLFSLAKPSHAALDDLRRAQAGEPFSYADVGVTRTGLPGGYRHGNQSRQLGRGEEVFQLAAAGLRSWQAHGRGGAEVRPGDAQPEEGLVVVLALRVALVWVTVACRVVYVTDDADRFGFAYGTLPHHVIEGEEAFLVERDGSGVVRFTVSAFFRPHGRAIAAVAPAVHVLDQLLVRRYLAGLEQHVRAQAGGGIDSSTAG